MQMMSPGTPKLVPRSHGAEHAVIIFDTPILIILARNCIRIFSIFNLHVKGKEKKKVNRPFHSTYIGKDNKKNLLNDCTVILLPEKNFSNVFYYFKSWENSENAHRTFGNSSSVLQILESVNRERCDKSKVTYH